MKLKYLIHFTASAKQSTISNIIYVGKGRKSQRSYEST